jgi:hypothetical protein
MADQPSLGYRYSHQYIDRGKPTQDSERMRRRLAAVMHEIIDLKDFGGDVPMHLGVDVPTTYAGYNWIGFLRICELQDLLDLVTLVYRFLNLKKGRGMFNPSASKLWCTQVNVIFVEENIHYQVDEYGGVHPRVDVEFEHNRAATIACLATPRYRNTLANFDAGMAALAKAPPDGKTAIRNVFGAAECLFKLMFGVDRLTGKDAQRLLEPLLQRANANDNTAKSTAGKLLSSFREWVDAAHNYRHEPGQEEPAPPPLPLAIHIVSVGASCIRWLAELDKQSQAKGA